MNLFCVAYATWRDTSAFVVDATASKASATGLVVKAFLLNILNPKLTLFFFLAFLPQFVQPSAEQPLLQMLLLSAVFMAMTFAVFVVYGLVAPVSQTGGEFHTGAELASLWFCRCVCGVGYQTGADRQIER